MKNYKLKINGNDYNVDINEVEGQEIKLDVNGTSYVVTVDQEIKQQPKPVVRPVAATSQVAPAASGTVHVELDFLTFDLVDVNVVVVAVYLEFVVLHDYLLLLKY